MDITIRGAKVMRRTGQAADPYTYPWIRYANWVKATLMNTEQGGIRSAVRRHRAEHYMVTSLVAFAVTVIVTRV